MTATANEIAVLWMDNALCAQIDTEIFFPEKGGSVRIAKSICGRCEVASECLQYALDNAERFGIWGGLTERERRKLKHSASGIDVEILDEPCIDCGITLIASRTYLNKSKRPPETAVHSAHGRCPTCDKRWRRENEAA